MIYLNSGTEGTTWRQILEASGGWTHYAGRCANGDVVIRYGGNRGQHSDTYVNGVRVLNRNLMMNKLDQSKRMLEAGVNIPLFWTGTRGYEAAGSPDQCVMKRATGTRGYGIQLIRAHQMYERNGRTFKTRDARNKEIYFQQYIPKDREFRAMMIGDVLAFVMEKTAPGDGSITWNLHQGAEWAAVPDERGLRRRIKTIGMAALDAVGYDFGAVDIMMYGGILYVLEVNSKPEFGPNNTVHFITAIHNYLASGRTPGGGQAEDGARQPRATRGQPQRDTGRPAQEEPVVEEAPAPMEDRLGPGLLDEVHHVGRAAARDEQAELNAALEAASQRQTREMGRPQQQGMTRWNFCPYCAEQFETGRGVWRFCPYCRQELV